MKLTSLRSRKNEKGAAMVEMALVLPILMVLVFGIIEFGWMLRTYQAVGQCAREGARTAALGGTVSNVEDRIESTAQSTYRLDPDEFSTTQIQYLTFTRAGTTWTPVTEEWQSLTDPLNVPSDADNYSQMRVTLTYDYTFITGALFSWLNGGNPIQLQQGFVMRKEGPIGGS